MKRFFYLISFAFLLFSCSRHIEVVETNFENGGEIQLQQNLEFIFADDIIEEDLVGSWDTLQYADFTPHVDGQYRWESPRKLVFSPSYKFEENTDYTMEFNDEVRKIATKKYFRLAGEEYTFHTPKFNLEQTAMQWVSAPDGTQPGQLNLSLNFTYPVRGDSLIKHMELLLEGEKIEYTSREKYLKDVNTVNIAVDKISNYENKELEIIIDEKLTVGERNIESGRKIEKTLTIPETEDFSITHLETSYQDVQGKIKVYANQKIAEDCKLEDFIELDPKIKFKVEKTLTGFDITGAFLIGTEYRLTVKEGIKSDFGRVTEEDFKEELIFGETEPKIEFSSKSGYYLTKKGSKQVGLTITNIDQVIVTIKKVYENNLLNFSRRGENYNYHYDKETDEYYDYTYYSVQNIGKEISKDTIETNTLPANGNQRLLRLDFDDPDKFNGIYIVQVEDEKHKWLQRSKIVSISDLGVIVRQFEDEILVAVNSILSANPVGGAKVTLLSRTNQKVVSSRTDGQGIAKLNGFNKGKIKFEPAMVIVESGNDINYLELDYSRRIDYTKFELSGAQETKYNVFMYGDRDLYRPGETVIISGIVRDKEMSIIESLPCKLVIYMPDGKKYKEVKLKLNEQGGFETKMTIPATLKTGSFSARLKLTNDLVIGTYYFSMEDFVPERIKVTLKTDKKSYKPGETVKLTGQADMLFGPPAADKKYELNWRNTQKSLYFKDFRYYTFWLKGTTNMSNQEEKGTTDRLGHFEQEKKLSKSLNNNGVISVNVSASVIDETGRPVNENHTFDIETQDIYLGIGTFDHWTNTGSRLEIPLVAVDIQGNTKKHKAVVRVYRKIWTSVLRRNNNGRYTYDSKREDVLVDEKVINVSGRNTVYKYTGNTHGSHEVRVFLEGEEDAYVSKSFYRYDWGSNMSSTHEIDKEGKILIDTDKENYQSGDIAKIKFNAPFNGRMLITIERNKEYEHRVVRLDNKSYTMDLRMKEEFLPNVYVSAVLYRPVDNQSIPLTTAYGIKSLKVEKKSNKIEMKIVAKEKTRSKRKQKIRVKTNASSGAKVTIAAVDEGILQIKKFDTPDPYSYFYRELAMGAQGYSIYPFLFPEFKLQTSPYGAGSEIMDMAFASEGVFEKLSDKSREIVALWSGILDVKSDGSAEFEIDVPEFNGKLRLMAVAYKDKSFGHAEGFMTVSDPIVISMTSPRVLSPGDWFNCRVTLMNTTDKLKKVDWNLKSNKFIEFSDETKGNLEVPANGQATFECRVKSKHGIGDANLTVECSDGEEKFSKTNRFLVRPGTAMVTKSESGVIKGGESKDVVIDNDFYEESKHGNLYISSSPLIHFVKELKYLVGYPYGCAEQTTSKAFPQLYYADMMKELDIKQEKKGRGSRYNVNEAIRKLQTMQRSDGGIGMWYGSGSSSWWASAYVAHFLTEAKNAGYVVSNMVLKRLYGYLESKLDKNDLQTYYYYDSDGDRKQKKIYNRTIIYSLYILSLADRPNKSYMNFYRNRTINLTDDSKVLLAGAYKLAGDTRSFKKILPADILLSSNKESGNSLSSPIRDLALSLNTLVETDPENKMVPEIAEKLRKKMKQEKWLSTQESVFAFLAMGKLAKSNRTKNLSVSVKASGKEIGSLKSNEGYDNIRSTSDKLSLKAKGSGSAYYYFELSGIPQSGSPEEYDLNMKVRRQYFDTKGEEITSMKFQQGDMVVVKLIVEVDEKGVSLDNVVITDLMPAGFEVENPRLGNSREFDWIKDANYPIHDDYREDRVNIFTKIDNTYMRYWDEKDRKYKWGYKSKRNYYYVMRAVTQGEFLLGGVSAECMYDSEYRSFNGEDRVEIE
jgi:uncharacterized protein YfaS (alpha-2-macroglobulin family)